MHDQAAIEQSAEATVAWARLHPVEWCRQYLRVEPDLWQIELMEAIADLWRAHIGVPTVVNHDALNLITVRAMHGPGKTFGIALCMHWFGFCFRTLSPCTAPKEKQLRTRLWPAFRKAMRDALPGYSKILRIDALKISWHNVTDWAFVAETGAQPENMQGYHDDFMLIPVDEASGVPEEIFPVLEGALSTGTIVCMILIGNPTKNVGTFHDSHMREAVSRHYYKIHVSLEKTQRVSRKWVARMVERYGEASPVVQVRCYGNFASMDKAQLISLEWITAACERELKVMNDGSIPRHRISVDVADGGEDSSIVTIASHYASFIVIHRQHQFNFAASTSAIELADAVERMWIERGYTSANADIVVDALGVGAGCAGALMKKGLQVIAYKGGESSDDPAAFRNRRVQSYIGMRNDLRDGRIVIQEDAFPSSEDRLEFEAQMCSVRMNLTSTERVDDLETRAHMRLNGIKSPDRADSMAMQWCDVRPAIEGRIITTGSETPAPMLIKRSEAAYADL